MSVLPAIMAGASLNVATLFCYCCLVREPWKREPRGLYILIYTGTAFR